MLERGMASRMARRGRDDGLQNGRMTEGGRTLGGRTPKGGTDGRVAGEKFQQDSETSRDFTLFWVFGTPKIKDGSSTMVPYLGSRALLPERIWPDREK